MIRRIQHLLVPEGRAYLAVARNLPRTGKLGIRHCIQNYVVLELPVVFEDGMIAVYELRKDDLVVDRTRDFTSRRDAGRDR